MRGAEIGLIFVNLHPAGQILVNLHPVGLIHVDFHQTNLNPKKTPGQELSPNPHRTG